MFERLSLADPTGGRYWRWLSDWRRRGWEVAGLRAGVRLELHRELAHALSVFHDTLPFLAAGARDIGRYKTAGELLDAASGSDPAIIRRTRQRERDQTVHLFENSGWTLIRLDGPDAARRWSWGTRWCTGTPSAYARYRLRGELLVLLTPAGKFQLATGSGELRDARDVDVDLKQVMAGAPTEMVVALRVASVLRRLEPQSNSPLAISTDTPVHRGFPVSM
nr:hypothetical protein [uncultured Devosia sp.]